MKPARMPENIATAAVPLAAVSKALDINQETLAQWVKRGHVKPTTVKPGTGRARLFVLKEILRICMIQHLGKFGVNPKAAASVCDDLWPVMQNLLSPRTDNFYPSVTVLSLGGNGSVRSFPSDIRNSLDQLYVDVTSSLDEGGCVVICLSAIMLRALGVLNKTCPASEKADNKQALTE